MTKVDLKGLKSIAPSGTTRILSAVAKVLNERGPEFDVSSPREVCHFLAQCAHESAGFRTTVEYASGAAYEGRKDLGNTKPGDGRRFKGRGVIQLTGRANYRSAGEFLGIDLERNPRAAQEPETSVLIALWYWKTRKLSKYANRDNIRQITRRINGGYNGLADRKAYFRKAWAIYGSAKSVSTTKVAAASVGSLGSLGVLSAVSEYAAMTSSTAYAARETYDALGPIVLAGVILLVAIGFGTWWIINERNKKQELYQI